MSWLLEEVSYIKICNRNRLRRPIKRDSCSSASIYFSLKTLFLCVASYKHWKLLMQANLNTQAAREKATCFRHLLKQLKERLSSYGCPTVRTMQGKPMLQWHQWQLAWLSELKNQGHIDNTLTVVTLVRGATVSAVNSRQVRKLLDNNTIMIITKLGRAWVNPTLVKVVYIFSYYLLEQASTRYVNHTLNIIGYDIP